MMEIKEKLSWRKGGRSYENNIIRKKKKRCLEREKSVKGIDGLICGPNVLSTTYGGYVRAVNKRKGRGGETSDDIKKS